MLKKIIIIFTMIISSCFAQDIVNDSLFVSDSLKNIMIYEKAFKTACKDKKIKDDEKAILKSLQHSLDLSKFTINSIETKISFQQRNVLDQSGRWPLVLQNIGWGAGLYGWALPHVFDVNDSKWYVASELLSFTTSLYLTHRYTKNMNIPHSRAQMMRLGSGVGFHYGYDFGKLLKLDYDENSDRRIGLSLMMASVPMGIYVGDKLNSRWQPTNGQSWAISLASVLGNTITTNLYTIISEKPREPGGYYIYNEDYGYDEYISPQENEKYKAYEKDLAEWQQIQAVVNMVSYPLSLYYGNRIFGKKDYSFGDAIILYEGYGMGMLYSLMTVDLVTGGDLDEDSKAFQLGIIGGGLLGTYMYDKMLTGKDYSFGESMILGVGTLSGITFGAAIGVITEADLQVYEGAMLAGGIIGTILTNKILSPEITSSSQEGKDIKISMVPDFKFLPDVRGFHALVPGINLNIEF